MPSRSYVSVFSIRGGEEEESTVFGNLGLTLHTANTTSTHHDRTSNFASAMIQNRFIWRRIRLLRGGVDGDKRADDFDDAPESSDNESESISITTSMTEGTSDIFATDPQNSATTHDSWQEKSGSMLSSFLSRFRAPVETNNDHTVQRTTNTSGIAHKMPHGPDGRGGGIAMLDRLHKSSNAQVGEKDFVITTEVTSALDDVLVADTTASFDAVKSVLNTGKNPPDKNSAAFAVPPNILPSHVKNGKEGNTNKMSKASKINEAAIGVNATIATHNISMSKALNTTDVILPSNGETRENMSLLNNASFVESFSGRELKDYSSSGYVSQDVLAVNLRFLYLHLSLIISIFVMFAYSGLE